MTTATKIQSAAIQDAKTVYAIDLSIYDVRRFFEKKFGTENVHTSYEKIWGKTTKCGGNEYRETTTVQISKRKSISFALESGMFEPEYFAN